MDGRKTISLCVALFFLSLTLSFPSPVLVTAGKGLFLASGPISWGLKHKACGAGLVQAWFSLVQHGLVQAWLDLPL